MMETSPPESKEPTPSKEARNKSIDTTGGAVSLTAAAESAKDQAPKVEDVPEAKADAPPSPNKENVSSSSATGAAAAANGTAADNPPADKVESIYEFSAKDIDGKDFTFNRYRGKVLIIVNVASNCGFTKGHYKELNDLYDAYEGRGLAIVGFPCNQFLGQEPACEVDIKEFVKKQGVRWDMTSKVDVNGSNAHPVFRYLKSKAGSSMLLMGTSFIKWNFTKFLINRHGHVVKRYEPMTSPLSMVHDVDKLIENQSL